MEKKVSLKNFLDEIKRFRKARLITITCIDEKKFRLIYQFNERGKINTLTILLPKKKPVIDSIADIFPTAQLYEREIHDFFGIEFKGNTRLHEKIFLPEGWKKKPPMLKNLRSATTAKYQEMI